MSEISAAQTAWTIRSSEPRPIWPLGCSQSPGPDIVVSYEIYALARDILVAQALSPIQMKGISREVVPYVVKGTLGSTGEHVEIFSAHMTGLDFYLDPSMLDTGNAANIRAILQGALNALEKNRGLSQLRDPI
jgi:adenylate cyclase